MESVKLTHKYMIDFQMPSENILFYNSKKLVKSTFRIFKGDLKEKIPREYLNKLNLGKKPENKIENQTLANIRDIMKKCIVDYKFERDYKIESRIKRLKTKIDLKKLNRNLKEKVTNSTVFIDLLYKLINDSKIDIEDKDIESAIIILDQLYDWICMHHKPKPIDITIVSSLIPIKIKSWIKREMNFISSDKYYENYKDFKKKEKEIKEHELLDTLMKGEVHDQEVIPVFGEYPLSDHYAIIYELYHLK